MATVAVAASSAHAPAPAPAAKKRVALGTRFESQEAAARRKAAAAASAIATAHVPALARTEVAAVFASIAPQELALPLQSAAPATKWDREQEMRARCAKFAYSRKELLAMRPKDPEWPGTQKQLLDVYTACPMLSPSRAVTAFVPILPPAVVPGPCGVIAGPCGYIYSALALPVGSVAGPTSTPPPPPTSTPAPLEGDPRRLEQRQKQILYGHNTVGYVNFVRCVPIHCRLSADPVEPFIGQKCSKRSWEGQVRKWRRLLHYYDDVMTPGDVPAARARIAVAERARRAARKSAAAAAEDSEDEEIEQ